MDLLRRTPMGALVIVVGVISVLGWVLLDGTIPLVISIVAGGLIALKATLGSTGSTPS